MEMCRTHGRYVAMTEVVKDSEKQLEILEEQRARLDELRGYL